MYFIYIYIYICLGFLEVNLLVGFGIRSGRRLRGFVCRLLLLFIVRLLFSCSLGFKVSFLGGLVVGRLRSKYLKFGIIWN